MPDGTEKQGDALAQEGGQHRPDGQSPSGTARNCTQDEHDKLMSERHRGLNKQIDALTKERDLAKAAHESLAAQLKELQGRLDAEEEARIKDNPEELDLYTRRKKAKETELGISDVEKLKTLAVTLWPQQPLGPDGGRHEE